MIIRESSLRRDQALLLALALFGNLCLASEMPGELPKMTDVQTFTAPPTLGFLTDVETLPDGRILVTDGHLTAILKPDGLLERYLSLPLGSNADTVETNRLIVAEAAVVLADSMNDRFIFYDSASEPKRIVPFGFDVWSLNGFVRHRKTGDLYVAAYFGGLLLHRFDADGRYLDSMIEADPKVHEGLSSAILAPDPSDDALWVSRLDRYEILRVGASVPQVVMSPSAPEFKVPDPIVESAIGGEPLAIRIKHALATSVGITVHGNYVLNTYHVAERGALFTDAFKKDGTPVARGVPGHELSVGKSLADGRVARLHDRTITIWRWQ